MGRMKDLYLEKTEQVSTIEGSVAVIEEFLEKSRADLYPWEQIAIEKALESLKAKIKKVPPRVICSNCLYHYNKEYCHTSNNTVRVLYCENYTPTLEDDLK